MAEEYNKFVLTTPQPPVPAANAAVGVQNAHKQWHKANEMAKCYMLVSMSSVLKHQHSAMATAAEIMQNLANLFGTQNQTAKSQAFRSMMTKTMKEGTSSLPPSFQLFKLNFEMNKRDYTLAELAD
ncbi:uncharacterized protein LOC125205217 [Salvia hispanica]|uniref:uncharacterized protein LOC125205217 n=1 Tax=Salvia hispanica TaxID=49212 RepID=UPI002009C574|nr:uncharacterized protein LOC125205217 [Salvia hispanica]